MRPLAEILSPRFENAARRAGRSLVRLVDLDEDPGPPWTAAVVDDRRTYEVRIDPRDERAGTCTCDRDTATCRHMWAAVLALDHRGRSHENEGPAFAGREFRPCALPGTAAGTEAGVVDDRLAWRLHAVSYLVDADACARHGTLVVTPVLRRRLRNGTWSAPRVLPARGRPPLPRADRLALAVLDAGRDPEVAHRARGDEFEALVLPAVLLPTALPILAGTGRLRIEDGRLPGGRPDPDRWRPVRVEEEPFRFVPALKDRKITGHLVRGGEELAPREVVAVLGRDRVLTRDRIVRFAAGADAGQARAVLAGGAVPLPSEPEAHDAALAALEADTLPAAAAPTPELALERRLDELQGETLVRGTIAFHYGGARVDAAGPGSVVRVAGRPHPRDLDGEEGFVDRFVELGGTVFDDEGHAGFGVPVAALDRVVLALLAGGWKVSARGTALRAGAAPRMRSATGVDWFELRGAVDFGSASLPLADAVRAFAGGARAVPLGDGTEGLLPSAWLAAWAPFLELGEEGEQGVRFRDEQAWLLDPLLGGDEDAGAELEDVRRRVRDARPRPSDPPTGFRATLRPYQREGLGWMRYLRRTGLGGCLADDMGLGKTVQVLALLAHARGDGPSLVVAPRSLVGHWIREAERFAPELRVLGFTGAARHTEHGAELASGFAGRDLVVTTYGLLRRDAEPLGNVAWDVVVLDEAQAIKNPASQASRAVRRLRARQRLALSGTPIENHLGELWALFAFLQPGLLERPSALRRLAERREPLDDEGTATLRRSVRPFLLRRTKESVLPELPEKTEQVLHCELPPAQRARYDELLERTRADLLGAIPDDRALQGQRMQALEALLRLRQVACHHGLVHPEHLDDEGGKLEVLWPRLEELRAEGHKALVFSQVPALLRILGRRLADAGRDHEYLDGQTTDRDRRVDRFQEDPGCGVFLISLKAGGVGLNLTAADYVFLLDPWWNPATEAQAVDRAHRLGQTRAVFAYRLIARGTIEEKVAALQDAKRDLADRVLGGAASGLAAFSREDLLFLLAPEPDS